MDKDIEKDLIEDDVDSYETVTIIDEDGQEIECFVIDAILDNNVRYLLVVTCEDFDNSEVDAFILKELKEEKETTIYTTITDDNEYNRVLILFQDNDEDYEIKL